MTTHVRCCHLTLATALCLGHSTATRAAGVITLVAEGKAQAAIHAPGENESAGRRFARRLQERTGVELPVLTAEPPADAGPLVAVGTPRNNPIVAKLVGDDPRLAGPGDEGFLLKTFAGDSQPTIVATGRTAAGVHHAVSELVSWRLRVTNDRVTIPDDVDVAETPALKYRIVWTWDGQANWATTVEEMHTIQKGVTGTVVVPYSRDGFMTHFKRSIDFLSDHKLNGYIIWGFLRDDHGGVDAGRELSRYAKESNVRILPGVCSQAAYGGFIFSPTNRYSLIGWLKDRPELCGRGKDGKIQAEAICPSKPANQAWLREGAEWLFKNLPDIGGINLENGDLQECYCDECVAAKKRPENDPNFLWDMMATQAGIVEVAGRMRPDAWITFATYVGFREDMLRGLNDSPAFPPKFLSQYPANAICQWTFTGMATPGAWPEGARPPKASFAYHIGLLHHGSIWGAPADPGRWWAAPGAMLDDCSTAIQFVCRQVHASGLPGLVIKCQTGTASPANEINYLAFEYFSWHPDRSYDDFVRDRLARGYGDEEKAREFLQLLHNTTREVHAIESDRQSALSIANT